MDRQDIDALLIGALYGELTPADEARLTAHLESHPTDRGALDDLKVTRQAVLESRIFSVQVEPPQAISALLLQEAHHRAPKRAVAAQDGEQRESWFFRFTRVFLAHPAMAAAAMLVLVLGGAALLKGGSAKKEISQSEVKAENAAATPASDVPTTTATIAAGSGSAAYGSAYGAGLYEGGEADGKDMAPADQGADKAAALDATRAERRDTTAQAQVEEKQKAPASHSMAVTTSKGTVKDIDRAASLKKADDEYGGLLGGDVQGPSGGGGGAGAAATGATIGTNNPSAPGRGATNGGYAQPPPAANKPMATPSPATIAAPASPPEPKPTSDAKAAPAKVAQTKSAAKSPEKPAEATVKQEAKADSSLIAWAKSEHARAVSLAQRGECTAAAKVALSVSSRASDYYAQYMATDRALKQCAQYINAEREKDAEKSGKARAQKRINAEEPANISK